MDLPLVKFLNKRNECFINATLQFLINSYLFRDAVLECFAIEKRLEDPDSYHDVLIYLQELLYNLQWLRRNEKETETITTNFQDFKNYIFKDLKEQTSLHYAIEKNQQADVHEFLFFLLDKIEQSSSPFQKYNPASIIEDCFKLYPIEILKCPNCHYVLKKEEKEGQIGIHVECNSELAEEIGRTKMIENYCCDNCRDKVTITAKTYYSSANIPSCLLFFVNRIKIVHEQSKMYCIKNEENMDMPLILNFQFHSSNKIINTKYVLRNIIMHKGSSINGGHYITHTISNNHRIIFDDDQINVIDFKEPLSEQINKKNEEKYFSSNSNYIILYECL
jgi:uncharacterized UBP type Zn finger protein